MGPPAKKRRRESSTRKPAQDEDDDDDELASHPQEIRVRRDPDIQLALKRANADHKLQSTMAHIIEKYSRDFEGIGDEIDMETGEIVVNNGHLRSMRDEGDVEGLWVEGDSNIDEDEGILLEDLTDEYSDNERPVNEVRDSQSDDGTNRSTRDQETHATLRNGDKAIDKASEHAPDIVNGTSKTPHGQDERLPSDLYHDGEVIDHPQFGPPSFQPGASSGFGPPPPGFAPWGMMPAFPMQAWGRDDIPPYFNMPPSMPGPWFSPGRYNFPTNNGQTSIWGRSQTKKTKRVGSMKGSSKRSTDLKSTDAPANEEVGITDGNDKISSKEQQPQSQEFPAFDQTINASDEDDDLIFSGITDSTPAKSSPVPPVKGDSTKKSATKEHTERALEETAGNVIKLPHHNDESDDTSRRRSGRARKQTEYMGKISWDDAREWRKSGQTLSVELFRANTSMREGFQSVDNTGEERLPSQEKTPTNVPTAKEAEMEENPRRQVVPDSQDTATPFNSSAPQPSQPKENNNKPSTFSQTIGPTMELSDDEAPLVLSRIKPPKHRVEALNADPQLPVEPLQDQIRADEAAVSAVGSSPKTIQNTRRIESRVADVLDKAVQSLKRKAGRPKGSTNRPKEAAVKEATVKKATVKEATLIPTIIVAPGDGSEPRKRKRGRPRKSDVAIQNIQVEVQDHQDEVTHSDEAPSYSEVLQQELADASLAIEEPETPHYLSHELRWLHKTKPKSKGGATHEIQDTAPDTQLRPRRSREKLQPTKDATEEPDETIEEPQDAAPEDAALEKQPSHQGSQEILQATDIIMEEPMEISKDPEVIEDDQPSSPIIHATLPNDVSSPDDDLPPIYEESLNNHGPSNDDRPPEEEGPLEENGPPEDAESLPSLPQDIIVQQVSTPRKPKDTITHPMEPPSSSHKPHTPRHTSIRTTRAPSSRRSLLSFVSDSESDTDGSRDELTRRVKSASKTRSARPSTQKAWRTTALTKEVHKTPSRRRVQEMSSPISTVRTPGGTERTCGVDGYHCGRDYCFTCF
ncbi:hypothetical protein FSARC_5135 [Fusarium sarcochroum]|uniref:Uncharacterized protein n=1 Tax=Fusarium sarcochroum TaxID=1208366 RepID=A0A8H4U035_9HYPO|nr:hypothetical protein FSARC_5135 [Fusarium sarcochroum]